MAVEIAHFWQNKQAHKGPESGPIVGRLTFKNSQEVSKGGGNEQEQSGRN